MPRYTEAELRDVVARSRSLSEVLRQFALRPAGGNHKRLRHWLDEWSISIEHFAADRRAPPRSRRPLPEILVEQSTYHRGHLKQRLYDEGVKSRVCELCGQSEEWHGRRMALILDHINGASDDNRLENLRIVCPNCAATLDTHCGRQNRRRTCEHCGVEYLGRWREQRFCSRRCNLASQRPAQSLAQRRVERPPYEQLLAEIAATSWSAVGRKYGVSDNAVRKWVRVYERERAVSSGEAPGRG